MLRLRVLLRRLSASATSSSSVRGIRHHRGAAREATGSGGAMFARLREFFHRRPLLSNCVIYGCLYAGAEVSQQTIQQLFLAKKHRQIVEVHSHHGHHFQATAVAHHHPHPHPHPPPIHHWHYDFVAVKRYALLGTVFYPPVFHAWYKWLDSKFRGKAAKIIGKKLVLDQFLLTPFTLAAFFLLMAMLESHADHFAELKEKFWPTFAIDCAFWLPVQALNFNAYRVPFLGVMGFVWLNILCIIKSLEKYMEAGEEGGETDDVASDGARDTPVAAAKAKNVVVVASNSSGASGGSDLGWRSGEEAELRT